MKKNQKPDEQSGGILIKTLRIMRLSIFFLFLFVGQTWAISTYSQQTRLSINMKNARVMDVLDEIEKQSEFFFFFSEKHINTERRVDISVDNSKIEDILHDLFLNTDVNYKILDRQIVLTTQKGDSKSEQPQRTITGKVSDSSGASLPGASVVVKGTTQGIITDMNGRYSIPGVPENAILQFSFVGMKTAEVAVTGKKTIDIILADETIGIEEVVAVGYGTQKKSDLTGSVSSFNTKALQDRPQPNIIQNLQGTVAGLNIAITGSNAEGSATATTIRGTNSITASNKPLIILDGIPFSGSWSELNPNDIQAIEILKDASSAAIYGARGSNGVILITTKKGKKEQMVVSYDGFMSMDEAINIPKLMDGETFYKYKVEALKAANTTTPTPANPEPWMGAITATEDRMHKAGLSTDWLKLSLRNGFKQQHNASFRGSVGKTSYYVSLNYTDSKGVSLNDKFNRVGFRINFEQELTPWLKFNTNTQFGRYDRSGKGPEFSKAFLMNPLSEAYDTNGNLKLSSWEDSSVAYARNPLSSINERE